MPVLCSAALAFRRIVSVFFVISVVDVRGQRYFVSAFFGGGFGNVPSRIAA